MDKRKYIATDLEKNLLCWNPVLGKISNPYERFYVYRGMTTKECPDVDRSELVKEIYRRLNWYDESKDKGKLDPDTFFASPFNLICDLCRKYDKKYYIQDFKRFCIEEKELSVSEFANMGNPRAYLYRYLWMMAPSTLNHYGDILMNKHVMDYLDAAHKLGNFTIIPHVKGLFTNFIKANKNGINECPIKSLQIIQNNWDMLSSQYGNISLESWKELYVLEDCYRDGQLQNSLYQIFISEQSFDEIFAIMDHISALINIRTSIIVKRLQIGSGISLPHLS